MEVKTRSYGPTTRGRVNYEQLVIDINNHLKNGSKNETTGDNSTEGSI